MALSRARRVEEGMDFARPWMHRVQVVEAFAALTALYPGGGCVW